MQVREIALKVCIVGFPRQSIHAGCGVLLELIKRVLKLFDAEVVEERGEPLLLPCPCDFPYALQRLCHAYPTLRPVRALLARIPFGPPFAPPAPQQIAPLCSSASQLLWRGPTSRARASSATAPRLPDADRRMCERNTTSTAETRDLPGSDTI